MRLLFATPTQLAWAKDSLHLFRTLKYLAFKTRMEFPNFKEMSQREQDLCCKQHNALVFRVREWLDEIESSGALTVRDDETMLMRGVLTYRPHHFFSPENVVGGQLNMLSGKHA
jgi:hypothetical protein